jgi:hypothetical protein
MGMPLSESESFAFPKILNGTPMNQSCASSGPPSLSTLFFFFVFFSLQNDDLWSKGV